MPADRGRPRWQQALILLAVGGVVGICISLFSSPAPRLLSRELFSSSRSQSKPFSHHCIINAQTGQLESNEKPHDCITVSAPST